MSYIIKEVKPDHFLEIDRVIQGLDIVTVVEPIYSHHAATKFDSIDECKSILEQIKQEGNYHIDECVFLDPDEIDAEIQRKKEEEEKRLQEFGQAKMQEVIDKLKKAGKTDEEISEVLDQGIRIDKEEYERVIKGE